MTWLHHWWVNIGLNNDCQATSHYLDQCLAKFVCHYLGANELIYSQTVAEPTDFSLVVCMASNLIFRKQRYSGRRRSYIYPTCKCRIAISSTSVRGLCRQGYCPACRTTLIATRFRVAVICPIIQVPHSIRVFFYFVWFVFINHIFQFYNELCTYSNILDIYLS